MSGGVDSGEDTSEVTGSKKGPLVNATALFEETEIVGSKIGASGLTRQHWSVVESKLELDHVLALQTEVVVIRSTGACD